VEGKELLIANRIAKSSKPKVPNKTENVSDIGARQLKVGTLGRSKKERRDDEVGTRETTKLSITPEGMKRFDDVLSYQKIRMSMPDAGLLRPRYPGREG